VVLAFAAIRLESGLRFLEVARRQAVLFVNHVLDAPALRKKEAEKWSELPCFDCLRCSHTHTTSLERFALPWSEAARPPSSSTERSKFAVATTAGEKRRSGLSDHLLKQPSSYVRCSSFRCSLFPPLLPPPPRPGGKSNDAASLPGKKAGQSDTLG
jgi:hypothetical protein